MNRSYASSSILRFFCQYLPTRERSFALLPSSARRAIRGSLRLCAALQPRLDSCNDDAVPPIDELTFLQMPAKNREHVWSLACPAHVVHTPFSLQTIYFEWFGWTVLNRRRRPFQGRADLYSVCLNPGTADHDFSRVNIVPPTSEAVPWIIFVQCPVRFSPLISQHCLESGR